MLFVFVFFFQAEDGIRDSPVTGVQTCALPIFRLVRNGRLPISVVKGSFQYARRRNLVIPYPYFERVMRLRAQKLGVAIK